MGFRVKLSDVYIDVQDKRSGLPVRFFRIEAVKRFKTQLGWIEVGQLGGYVQSEDNINQFTKCWIFDNAIVSDNAYINGEAIICDNAIIRDNATVTGNACVKGKATI